MDYNAPSGSTDPNAGFVGKTASTVGSKVPPKAAEYPQREIVNAEKAAGLTPSNTDTTQLAQAIGRGLWVGTLGANANALVGSIGVGANASAPGILQVLSPWTRLRGVALQTNTQTSVTITLSGVGGSASATVQGQLLKKNGQALAIGDVPVNVPFEFQPDGSGAFRMVGAVASDGGGGGSSSGASVLGITGLLPTAWGSTIAVSPGACGDSTWSAFNRFGAAMSLNPALGPVLNGFTGGTAYQASTSYHVFAVWGTSAAGVLAHTANVLSTGLLPTGCTYWRRIFSFRTDTSGNPLPYAATEEPGGGLTCILATSVQDVNGLSIAANTPTLFNTSVPSGLPFKWEGGALVDTAISGVTWSGLAQARVMGPAEPAVTLQNQSGQPTNPIPDVWLNPQGLPGGSEVSERPRFTNTSGQLVMFANVALTSAIYVVTRGWRDARTA